MSTNTMLLAAVLALAAPPATSAAELADDVAAYCRYVTTAHDHYSTACVAYDSRDLSAAHQELSLARTSCKKAGLQRNVIEDKLTSLGGEERQPYDEQLPGWNSVLEDVLHAVEILDTYVAEQLAPAPDGTTSAGSSSVSVGPSRAAMRIEKPDHMLVSVGGSQVVMRRKVAATGHFEYFLGSRETGKVVRLDPARYRSFLRDSGSAAPTPASPQTAAEVAETLRAVADQVGKAKLADRQRFVKRFRVEEGDAMLEILNEKQEHREARRKLAAAIAEKKMAVAAPSH